MIQIRLRYFASFAEAAGIDGESFTLDHHDARRLFDDLKARYAFRQSAEHVRLAINDRFSNWQTPLAEGDTIVFIPPVSGG